VCVCERESERERRECLKERVERENVCEGVCKRESVCESDDVKSPNRF